MLLKIPMVGSRMKRAAISIIFADTIQLSNNTSYHFLLEAGMSMKYFSIHASGYNACIKLSIVKSNLIHKP